LGANQVCTDEKV